MVQRHVLFALVALACPLGRAADLTVDLGPSREVAKVLAVKRWDADGQPTRPIDPKAQIDAPAADAQAEAGPGNRWTFRSLPPGRYDLIVFTRDRARVDGFHYPPVLDFDKPLPGDATVNEDVRARITRDIARSRHYENKVTPLFLGGDEKEVRVLMQLVRDQPTSYDAEYGQPIATVRHEVWRFTFRYGGWTKEKRTVVLDRVLLPRKELQEWTWVWAPQLGGIDMKTENRDIQYELPARFDAARDRGWLSQ